jgi:hypothetical protein
MLSAEDERAGTESFVDTAYKKWQYVMDKLSPQIALRWGIFAGVFFIYFLRVYLVNGWYIVTYALGIYLLNQLIGFLSPQFDPEESDGDMDLPMRETEEFRLIYCVTKFRTHSLTFPISLDIDHLLDAFQNLNFGMHALAAHLRLSS